VSSLFGFTLGQEGDSENSNSGMPSGVTITLNDPNAGLEFEVARELYLSPTFMRGEISTNSTTTNLSVSVTSRINTEVEVRTNHPDLITAGESRLQIRAGSRIGVSFTAFSPHSGTVEFVNTDGEIIEAVDYVVTKKRTYRQNVSASVSHEGDVSARYGIRFDDGYSFNVNVSRDDAGDVSGSYLW
jgi:hypothetical protein